MTALEAVAQRDAAVTALRALVMAGRPDPNTQPDQFRAWNDALSVLAMLGL